MSMTKKLPSTQEKALQINLDAQKYGTFAEIGAGQEVARWFFHVGKASSTVAKSISAYDVAISDDLYGAVPLRSSNKAVPAAVHDRLQVDSVMRRGQTGR